MTSKPVRCAIYTRVSTEHGLEQDFNSLDAQHDAAQAYIRSQAHAGWTLIRSRYDDGCRSRKSYPHIATVQSGKNWRDDDRSAPLDSPPLRCAADEPLHTRLTAERLDHSASRGRRATIVAYGCVYRKLRHGRSGDAVHPRAHV